MFYFSSSADLVPIYSFGENEVFDQVENPRGTWLRYIQERLQSIMGISLPLFHARGVFQYSFGLMPYRKPINTVGKSNQILIKYHHCQVKVKSKLKPYSKSVPITFCSLSQTDSITSLSFLSLLFVVLYQCTGLICYHFQTTVNRSKPLQNFDSSSMLFAFQQPQRNVGHSHISKRELNRLLGLTDLSLIYLSVLLSSQPFVCLSVHSSVATNAFKVISHLCFQL